MLKNDNFILCKVFALFFIRKKLSAKKIICIFNYKLHIINYIFRLEKSF